VEHAVVMAESAQAVVADLPLSVTAGHRGPSPLPAFPALASAAGLSTGSAVEQPGLSELETSERRLIVEALHKCGGVQSRAAALLGITPRQIGHRMKKYRIA
jgi:Nif-specific regulatory protein